MESLAESIKRKGTDISQSPKMKRNNGSETMNYLVNRTEKELEQRQQQMFHQQQMNQQLQLIDVVKVGHKFLLPVGKNWKNFVMFRRLPVGQTCHIKRATCNILICLRNIVILRKSWVEKVNIFLK